MGRRMLLLLMIGMIILNMGCGARSEEIIGQGQSPAIGIPAKAVVRQTPTLPPAVEAPTEAVQRPTPTALADIKEKAEAMIELAKKDLAERLGISPAEIELVAVEPVIWLGPGPRCPPSEGTPLPGHVMVVTEEGERYELPRARKFKDLTQGYLITLAVGERRYRYCSDGVRVIRCEK